MPVNEVYAKYNSALNKEMKGYGVLNYLSSHDDGQPFDPKRENAKKTGTLLLLAPGASQVYYGDESARPLIIDGTEGDATLRSLMNWEELENDKQKSVLSHWQKLGQFRARHASVGAGIHNEISNSEGFVFSRVLNEDKVVVGIDLKGNSKSIKVEGIFENGTKIRDAYSGAESIVENGKLTLSSEFEIVLLEKL